MYTNKDEINEIDNNIKNKQSWEELDDLYLTLAKNILAVMYEVKKALSLYEAKGGKQSPALVNIIKGIRDDSVYFTEEIVLIKKKHEGFKGVIIDGDELVLCLELFTEYAAIEDKFKNIVFNPMLTLSNIMTTNLAELATKEKIKSKPLDKKNPKVKKKNKVVKIKQTIDKESKKITKTTKE